MPQSLTVPFAGKDLTLALPPGWEVAEELHPAPEAALPDPADALRAALARPIGCEALDRAALAGKRIVLAVDDVSRPTPTHRFFGALVEELIRRGAEHERITVLAALGIHRPMTQAEMEAKLGREALGGLRWLNHDARDPAAHVDLGTTSRGTRVRLNRHLAEADLVICVGAVEPHLLLGFGGGLKMILPGLAHEETIAQNHMQGASPDRYNYVGERESPMRMDLEEAVQRLGARLFVVNALMNERLEVTRFVCGHPIAAQRAGAAAAEAVSARPVAARADVALVVSNPMNADLRQGMKCLGNAEPGVRPGGLLVGLLECRHGIGDLQVPPRSLPNGVLRLILRALGKDRVLWFIDRVKKGAGVEERFLAHFSMQVVRQHPILVHSPGLPPDAGKRLGLFLQYPDPQTLLAAAGRRLPRARVLVMPHGGATYPVVR